jgi:DNA-binding response OmpR family regulator
MRLLCADDEEDIRTILELALSLDPDMQATIVPSGFEVLRLAHEESWDAFVLDGMMPGMDGYETCRRLKEDPHTSATPVIFLSAKTRREDIDRAIHLGAIATLPKPFDPMTLAAELRSALAV